MNWKLFKREKFTINRFNDVRERYDSLQKEIDSLEATKTFLFGNLYSVYNGFKETPVETLINKEITSLRAKQKELSV